MKVALRYLVLFILVLAVLSLLSPLYLTNFPFLVQFLPLLFLFYLPGLLTMVLLKISLRNIWLYIIHSLGISIVWSYLIGIFSSSVLPYLGYARPLEVKPFLFIYATFILILLFLALVRTWRCYITLSQLNSLSLQFGGYLVVILLSLVSLIGAFTINSGGTNLISIGWLVTLTLVFFLLSLSQRPLTKFIKPYLLLLLSLSLLWTLSARSSGLVGWDIIQELLVAKTTQASGLWTLEDIKDAYNACLSITLLPTIISNLTAFPIEVIYKYIYPFIFAHFPIVLYSFFKKQVNRNQSLMAVLYILAQPFFIQPMVALARQEVAFFFFSLLLLTIFTETIKNKTRMLFIIFYIFGLVTSHYSTTYVAVVLFSLVYAVVLFLNIWKYIPLPQVLKLFVGYQNWIKNFHSNVKLWIVLILVFFTYSWYFLITKTAGNVTATVQQSISNMSDLFKGEQKSQEVQQAIPGSRNTIITNTLDLDHFEQTYIPSLQNLTPEKLATISSQYQLQPLSETQVNPSIPNRYAKSLHQAFDSLKDGLKIMVIIGVVIFFLATLLKPKSNLDLVVFSSVSAGLLLLMILHPTLGVHYNISRIYLQLLIFLALPLIVGLNFVLGFLSERGRLFIIGLLMVLSFFNLQGILTPIIGGIPVLHFYNRGTDYDKFYMYDSELYGVNWLEKNRNFQNTVYGDSFAGLRVRKAAGFFTNPTILPVVFANNALAYVYLSHTNIINFRAQVNFESKFLRYVYPRQYLEDYKNLIYSNKNSAVYK